MSEFLRGHESDIPPNLEDKIEIDHKIGFIIAELQNELALEEHEIQLNKGLEVHRIQTQKSLQIRDLLNDCINLQEIIINPVSDEFTDSSGELIKRSDGAAFDRVKKIFKALEQRFKELMNIENYEIPEKDIK